jgi:hypothetical protein
MLFSDSVVRDIILLLNYLSTFIDDAGTTFRDLELYGIGLTDNFTVAALKAVLYADDHSLFLLNFKYLAAAYGHTAAAAGTFLRVDMYKRFLDWNPFAHCPLLIKSWLKRVIVYFSFIK